MCRCTIVLDMEVWQSTDGIFLGQGKYAVEILKRFGMMAMATPMESNLKLLSDASSESVDATIYRQMIGSLMYLTNTRLDTCLAVNTLRHVHLMVTKHAGVQFIMGSSMMRIKRLTWRVTLIQIGHEVPSIGRALQAVASIWD